MESYKTKKGTYKSKSYKTNNENKEKCKQQHPRGWTPDNHYGMCGQNCPCCRKQVGDILGVCPICK